MRVIPRGVKTSCRAKRSERQVGFASQHLAQQDESNVAVLGARARRCNQPRGERRADQFFARWRELEQLLISRQPAGVRQQHADRDRLALGLLMTRRKRNEIGQKVGQGRIQR